MFFCIEFNYTRVIPEIRRQVRLVKNLASYLYEVYRVVSSILLEVNDLKVVEIITFTLKIPEHQVNKPMQFRPPRTPLLYSNTGVFWDIHCFFIFSISVIFEWNFVLNVACFSLSTKKRYSNGKINQLFMIYTFFSIVELSRYKNPYFA